jgi:energy-converting hydrogenase Eha subunit E
VSLPDAAGIAGVLMILAAYAGATSGKLDPKQPIALSLNLFGAGLILLSLAYDFNLSAFLMEAAWAVVALIGLVRFALKR